jgi:transcriptional regulator with XRE-family HTH domain
VVSERRAFGDRARRQRERRGVSLQAIAQATKVSAALFAALERGDCSRWPGGVYSRAYVRAYAEAIGLDPNEAVEDFTAAFGDTAWPDGQPGTPARRITTAALRLSMDDEPDVRQTRTLRQAAVAGADLVVAFALAWLAHIALGTGIWTTVGLALGYHACGRMMTDEPVVGWIIGRFRTVPPVVDLSVSDEVAVSDVASTTA